MLFYFEFLNVDSCSLWIVSSCILLWDYFYWGFFAFASTSCFREITSLSSVQLLSRVGLCNPMDCCQASLSIANSQTLLKLMSIESVMPSNHLILCRPLLPLSNFPSIRLFSNEPDLRIRWPKYWNFIFSISPSNKYSGLISLRIDWFDLLAVQGTLKSLPQHHSSKTSILQPSAFFIVQLQLSHPYMTTGKTIALTRQAFVGKVITLLFNMLSRLVITFLPRSKRLLISWLQSPSAVILEHRKINSATVSTVSPSICHEVMEPDAMILVFWMLSFKPTFSLSSFTFIKRLLSSSSLSAIRVVSSAYLSLLIFPPAVLIPACASSSLVFLMMYSAYKLNKQGDNIQPWCTRFPIWNQSVVPCPVLTFASWPAYRFLKRQVRWSGIPISWRIFPQFIVIHTVKGFGLVNKAEIDIFLELSCFFDDPAGVGSLISGSSAFSKTSLNIWKFTVHVLSKPGLENFEHYFTSMWDECNCVVVWGVFDIAFLRDWNENWPFPVLCPLLSFPNLLAHPSLC